MNLLAIDTATEACSVALQVGTELLHHDVIAPQQHAALLLPMIDELLATASIKKRDLDGLVFGRGPGSFTGVRIATATVQGIALGLNCGVIGISTLAAIAHRAWREQGAEHCIAAIDARMQQVYWGCYVTSTEGITQLHGHEQVSDPARVRPPAQSAVPAEAWCCVGTGAARYEQELEAVGVACADSVDGLLPSALDMLKLSREGFLRGEQQSAAQVAPVYLRDKVALTEQERRAAARN